MTPSTSIEAVRLWYHTIELPGGVLTPGWFDLRALSERLPWPDIEGKRCLDVGTYDGFYAFELERRGASEVLAIDIGDERDWDLPTAKRDHDGQTLARSTGSKGLGFSVAKRALHSNVEKRVMSVYDLSPERIGMFDIVVCGSLMLHLRDPVGALESIRSVCRSWFLSVEEISLGLNARFRRRAVADMRFKANPTQWWVPNIAGYRQMVEIADFDVVKAAGPFVIPFGIGHPPRGRDVRARMMRLFRRALSGGDGVPHATILARPRM